MSKQSVKTTINDNIKQNGHQEITGQIMNSVLNEMVDNLAEEASTTEKLSELEGKIDGINTTYTWTRTAYGTISASLKRVLDSTSVSGNELMQVKLDGAVSVKIYVGTNAINIPMVAFTTAVETRTYTHDDILSSQVGGELFELNVPQGAEYVWLYNRPSSCPNPYITLHHAGLKEVLGERIDEVEGKTDAIDDRVSLIEGELVNHVDKVLTPVTEHINYNIASSGIFERAVGQAYKINIYDISSLVGETLTIKGNCYGANRLWSICNNIDFESVDDILTTSTYRGTGWTIKEYTDTLVVENGMIYLAVVRYGTERPQCEYVAEERVIDELKSDVERLKSEVSVLDWDVICWGDSLTAGNQDGSGVSVASELKTLLGTQKILNCGIGGEGVNDIAWRQGGNTMVIPSGAVNGTYSKEQIKDTYGAGFVALLKQTDIGGSVNPVSINGYLATITYVGNNQWQISGYQGGNLSSPVLVSSNGSTFKSKIAVIGVGTNGSVLAPPYTLQKDFITVAIDNMIAHHGNQNYIIIAPSGYTPAPADIDSADVRPTWDSVTTALAKYGQHMIDMRTELVNNGMQLVGLTPTANDQKAIAKNYIPYSLLNFGNQDRLHLNQYGYRALAIIIARRIRVMGMM